MCSTCEEGSYSAGTGASVCDDCPGDQFSTPGATSCDLCNRNFYYSKDRQCVPCPLGTDCPNDGAASQEVIIVKSGDWRATNDGTQFLECPIEGSCDGGINFTKGGDGYCAKGHTGVLCGVCDDGFFHDKETNVCRKCDSAAKSQSLWTMLVGVAVFVASYGIWKSGVVGEDAREKTLKVFSRSKQKLSIAAIMMQIATARSDNLSINFPVAFAEFLSAFNFININPFQVIAFGCIGEVNYYHTLLGMTLAPLVICALLMGRYLYKKDEAEKAAAAKAEETNDIVTDDSNAQADSSAQAAAA